MGKTKDLESNFFRANLIRLRNEKGWSQSVLASRVVEAGLLPKLSDGAVKMWETGERSPGPKSRRAIAKIFEVTESYLLDDHSTTVAPKAPQKDPTRIEAIGRLNQALSKLPDNAVRELMSLAEAGVIGQIKAKGLVFKFRFIFNEIPSNYSPAWPCRMRL